MVLDAAHLAAAVLAAFRLTELLTVDRIAEPIRRRWPIYLWTCFRCVSVWAGVTTPILFVVWPWANWPLAISYLYIVWAEARERDRNGRGVWQRMHPIAGGVDLWADVLASTRATTWEGAGVSGGIPSSSWTRCGSPIAAYTGSASTINNAIAACGTNQYVSLGAGTFTLSSGLDWNGKSNVALRGAGADQTKIILTSAAIGTVGCQFGSGVSVCIDSGQCNQGQGATTGCGSGPNNLTNWTAGYTAGTTVITLQSVTGLTTQTGANGLLFLDQLDDTVDGYPAAGDIVVNGTTTFTGEGASDGASMVRTNRHQVHAVRVMAINGTQVTIDPPLHAQNWRASQTPQAWWGNVAIRNSGIEDLSIDHSAVGRRAVCFQNAFNCWMKGVRSIANGGLTGTYFTHITMLLAARITVRDSYFHGVADFANPTTHYGIEVASASDVLIENNILREIQNPLQLGSDQGSVYAYNYGGGYTLIGGGGGTNVFLPHNTGGILTLVEGNSVTGYTGDIIHGTRNMVTMFRNHMVGGSPEGTVIWDQAYNRFFNLIGNVLGGAGISVYELDLSFKNGNEVYSFGDKRLASYTFAADPRVKVTSMRWGNYDTVTGATRWRCVEVPTGITNFSNSYPTGSGCPGVNDFATSLPPSFYLAAQPTTWWGTPYGTPPWPAVGPDVTGGDVAGYNGHAFKNPARLCFENAALDTAGYGGGTIIRVFNAATCYVGGVAPTPPPPEPLGTFPITKTAPRGVFVLRHR